MRQRPLIAGGLAVVVLAVVLALVEMSIIPGRGGMSAIWISILLNLVLGGLVLVVVWACVSRKPGGSERDVTDLNERLQKETEARQKLELDLQAAQAKLDAEDEAKTRFLAHLSHELRSPLTAVLGYAQSIQEQVFGPLENEKYREYVDSIMRSGNQLHGLIDDLFDVTALEAGRLEFRDEVTSIPALLTEVAEAMSRHADKRSVTLAVETADSLPELIIDQRRLKQVLVSLVSNAITYSGDGGEVTVTGAWESDEELRFDIADQGSGMSEADLEAAISTFSQVEHAKKEGRDGAGIGLPLAKALTEAMGGSLKITSKPGQGTTATVVIGQGRIIETG